MCGFSFVWCHLTLDVGSTLFRFKIGRFLAQGWDYKRDTIKK